MSDAVLHNSYKQKIEEDTLQSKAVAKKLEVASRVARDHAQKMLLGDDAKVGEAVILSFFASLYGDITTAFKAYKENRLRDEHDKLKDGIDKNKDKIKTLKEAEDKTRKINEFTRLQIQKSALEQKLNDKTISESEKKSVLKTLGGVAEKIEKVADFFEKSVAAMSGDVEKMEEAWLGKSAELFKELRLLSPEFKEGVLKNISLEDLVNNDSLVDELIKKVSNSIIENDLVDTLDGLKDRAEKSEKSSAQELK
ncbi:MAG: hypothetical protein PHO62_07815 [Sulfurimonas sp.]|uniref:hypothetical protein n=1 Tax=Sulfurimonas sp. TaxID=2022749 RepID=UPI0026114456|nr:hypothetical protein [Sulfurimonas sp.]MDD5373313.1 hypothetical protein [Sulfurimonas sp.]